MANVVNTEYEKVESLLAESRLLDAIYAIRKLADNKRDAQVIEDCNRLDEEYRRMLYYVQQGIEDPMRAAYYNDYAVKAYSLLDTVKKTTASVAEFSLFFSQCRIELSKKSNIKDAIASYLRLCSETSLFNAISEGVEQVDDSQKRREQALRDLFNIVWVTFPISTAEKNDLLNFFTSEAASYEAKLQILPAILLSVLQFFDSNKVELLIDTYCSLSDSENSATAVVALTCAILALLMNGNHPIKSSLAKKLKDTTAVPAWNEDIKNVLFSLIKTIDTERITKKVQSEILPELHKMQQDLNKFFANLKIDEKTFDISSLEENPEWMEELQNSSLADKMQEIFKLQNEGGDIFMSAFNQLKTFPFFNDVSAWFTPFSEDNSVVGENEEMKDVARMVKSLPNVCDSDKFSIMLLYSSNYMPQSQRDSIMNQMKMNNLNFAGLDMSSIPPETIRRSHITNFVQNLYRFFKLYRRKGEFNNPFAKPFDIVGCRHLSSFGNTTDEELNLISEFYFKHKYYDEALKLFLYAEKKGEISAKLLQKIGFCYQRHAMIETALEYYRKAELMETGSVWTISRIAQCLQMLNRHREAVEYLDDLLIRNQDDTKVMLQKSTSLVSLKKYDEAMSILNKLCYMEQENMPALRMLAYCHVMKHKYDAAINCFRKIVNCAPTADDYIVMGNIALAQKDCREAINCYELASERHEGGLEGVIADVKKSEQDLIALGVDTSLLPMLLDCLVRL